MWFTHRGFQPIQNRMILSHSFDFSVGFRPPAINCWLAAMLSAWLHAQLTPQFVAIADKKVTGLRCSYRLISIYSLIRSLLKTSRRGDVSEVLEIHVRGNVKSGVGSALGRNSLRYCLSQPSVVCWTGIWYSRSKSVSMLFNRIGNPRLIVTGLSPSPTSFGPQWSCRRLGLANRCVNETKQAVTAARVVAEGLGCETSWINAGDTEKQSFIWCFENNSPRS
jgi:hypothetical protein